MEIFEFDPLTYYYTKAHAIEQNETPTTTTEFTLVEVNICFCYLKNNYLLLLEKGENDELTSCFKI